MTKAAAPPLGPLYRALHAAMLAVAAVPATAWCGTARARDTSQDEADGFWFAPLAKVRSSGRAALGANGLMLHLGACSIEPTTHDRDLRADLRFDLVHAESGAVLSLPLRLPVARPSDFKDATMAVAATVSHAWRVVLMQLLCIETTEGARCEPPRPSAPARAETPASDDLPGWAGGAGVPSDDFTYDRLTERLGIWCRAEEVHNKAEGLGSKSLGLDDARRRCAGLSPIAQLETMSKSEAIHLYGWLGQQSREAARPC